MSNKDSKSTSVSKSVRLHPSHLQLLEDVLSKLTPHQLDLIKRAHKLGRKHEKRGGAPSDEGALLAHAIIVGLTQLHHALAPNSSYHRQADVELSHILHLCIQDQGEYAMTEIEKMVSTLEELHQAEE